MAAQAVEDLCADRPIHHGVGLRIVAEHERHVEDADLRIEIGQNAGPAERDVEIADLQTLLVLALAAQLSVGIDLDLQLAAAALLDEIGEMLRRLAPTAG